MLNKLIFSIVFLAAAAEMPAADRTVTIVARNLGDRDVTVSRSYDGIYMPENLKIEFDADSSVTFDIAGESLEYFLVGVSGDTYRYIPIYSSSESPVLVIDPASPELFITDRIDDKGKAAADAVMKADGLFIDYVTRKSDPLSLRGDSIATSVESKLTGYVDSLCATLSPLPETMRDALRQQIAMNIGRLWIEVSAGAVRKYESQAPEWHEANARMKRWLDVGNDFNALSEYFERVASEYYYERLATDISPDNYWKMSPECRLAGRFDYFKNNYSGKNREHLLGKLIFGDTRNAEFTENIDSLYTVFKGLSLSSGLRTVIDKAEARNIEINSPSAIDPEIVFIESREDWTLDSVTDLFNGKPLLVDVWATWCGPCRSSFAHADKIREFASKNGIEMLYISIDEDENRDKKVRKMVKNYGLKGNHLIMTPKMKQQIYDTYGDNSYLLIPAVALYDRDGRLLQKRFAESEDYPALLEAIKALL